jgi:hypothetical protein
MQERAKWREGELLKVLDQKRRVREHARALAMTTARWQPGVAWRAEEGQRRGARAAASLGAPRGSCQRQEVAPVERPRW